MDSNAKIGILGLGGVGVVAANLLHDLGYDVVGFDVDPNLKGNKNFETFCVSVTPEEIEKVGVDAVLSCLPYHLNIDIIEWCAETGVHYFDLTEDVTTTKFAQESATDKSAIVPQCGLAPGLVNIVAANMIREYPESEWKNLAVEMSVGALPQSNTSNSLGYAVNWSPQGLINEYLNKGWAILNGEVIKTHPLGGYETLFAPYWPDMEMFNTSGGIGTMYESFKNMNELTYRTLRYDGHWNLLRFMIEEAKMDFDTLIDTFMAACPADKNDVVYMLVKCKHWTRGHSTTKSFKRRWFPLRTGGGDRTAITWTTAHSAVAAVDIVLKNDIKGFVKQEDLCYNEFSNHPLVGPLLGYNEDG